jgi:hypothetical protein
MNFMIIIIIMININSILCICYSLLFLLFFIVFVAVVITFLWYSTDRNNPTLDVQNLNKHKLKIWNQTPQLVMIIQQNGSSASACYYLHRPVIICSSMRIVARPTRSWNYEYCCCYLVYFRPSGLRELRDAQKLKCPQPGPWNLVLLSRTWCFAIYCLLLRCSHHLLQCCSAIEAL